MTDATEQGRAPHRPAWSRHDAVNLAVLLPLTALLALLVFTS